MKDRIVSMDEVAADMRHGAEIRVLLGPRTVGATSGFMGVAIIRPGEAIREHYHPYSEEFMFVVDGEVIASVDGRDQVVTARQGMLVPVDARHRLVNRSDRDVCLVFALSPLAPRPELGHVVTEGSPGGG